MTNDFDPGSVPRRSPPYRNEPRQHDLRSPKLTWYTFNCALFAAVGSLLYGIDSGIISTTIAHPTFTTYFAPYTSDVAGAIVSTFGAGSFFGVLFAGWSADAWGRKRSIQFAAIWALIAGAIQAGSVHVGMLIAGRIVGGFAIGIMNMTIPIYNSEISPAGRRGLVSGLHAQFVGFGFAFANWIGFACSYAKGQLQWRFPLAVQCIPALILLIGSWFLPYSPRWLLKKGRENEAFEITRKLNESSTVNMHFEQEVYLVHYEQMKRQIEYEEENKTGSFSRTFATRSARRRLLLSILIQVFTQLSGINVINYQTTLYQGLGATGHTVRMYADSDENEFTNIAKITLLAAIYGIVGPAANLICLAYVDRWGRKSTMWITGLAMACDMALIMGFTAKFSQSSNRIGQGFATAFIFSFSAIYSLGYNSIHYIYVPEILNQRIRAQGSSVAVCSNVLINIIFNQISPRAFANIGYRYYGVFICTNMIGAVIVSFFFVETKGKTLEEINALFGEPVINAIECVQICEIEGKDAV